MRAAGIAIAVIAMFAGQPRAAPPERPNALAATGGGRLTLLSGEEALGRIAVSVSRAWAQRWHTAVHAGIDLGANGTRILQATGEVGIWLHASHKVDLLLAWRVGYARFQLQFATLNAVAVEPVAELAYALSDAAELRFAPVVISAYYSGLWQGTIGPEVGIAWRL